MRDAAGNGRPPPPPGRSEVDPGSVPADIVHAVVEGSERGLRALNAELEDLRRQARASEERVRAHLAGTALDDALETYVLEVVAAWLKASVRAGPDGRAGAAASAADPRPPAPPNRVAPPPPPRVSEPALPSLPAPPDRAVRPSPARALPPPPRTPPPRPAPPGTPSRPRTVVVDRRPPPGADRHRVTGGTVATGAAPGRAGPLGVEAGAGARRDDGSPVPGRGGWASRIPSRLVIQVGIVLVIAALLLLKVG